MNDFAKVGWKEGWYVIVKPMEGTDYPLEKPYYWGPFSTKRNAETAAMLLIDIEWLGEDLTSSIYHHTIPVIV